MRELNATYVEADPANPEEAGAEDNVANVLRAVGEKLGAVAATTAKENADGESSNTRAHVDGATTGKVKIAERASPSVVTPNPGCEICQIASN